MENIRIGFVGLGGRGQGLLKDVVLAQGEQVVAVCDEYEDRAQAGAQHVMDAGQAKPAVYLNYKDMIPDEYYTYYPGEQLDKYLSCYQMM